MHIYNPKVLTKKYRILPKYCRYFIGKEYDSFKKCLEFGLSDYAKGFRIFIQNTYEWHEPFNKELVKVGDTRGHLN